LADEGKSGLEIMHLFGLSRPTIFSLRKKYLECHGEPIVDVFKDEPRGGRPVTIDTRLEANITVMACSDPPDGSAKWTWRMMADRLVKLDVIDSISHESVRGALKKPVQPWLSEQWRLSQITGAFLWHMEDVLDQRETPDDRRRPLIYFDERPCFLIEGAGSIIPMSPGKAKRYD